MPDLKQELDSRVEDLRISSEAARRLLCLLPNEFAWFHAEIQHPMEPQPIVPESSLEHDFYTSDVTYYGGVIQSGRKFVYGHVYAEIAEPITGDVRHHTAPYSLPKPWIPRMLTMHDGFVVVDTLTMTVVPIDGPVISEECDGFTRYRQTTLYHIASKTLAVKSGSGRRRVEEHISHLPPEIVANRLEIMIRTIACATDIFRRIGHDIQARIQYQTPRDI